MVRWIYGGRLGARVDGDGALLDSVDDLRRRRWADRGIAGLLENLHSISEMH